MAAIKRRLFFLHAYIPRILTGYHFHGYQFNGWQKTHHPFSGRHPPTNVCQLFLDGCQRLLVEVRIVMKVFSQVSTIPGGPEKRKLVLCCSYKRTAAQYLAISLLSLKTLPPVTKPPGVGQVSHRQWASGQSGHTYKGNLGPSGFV